MNPLIVGTLLALVALSYVLYPLLVSDDPAGKAEVAVDTGLPDPARAEATDALREIEFDRATGKLSDSDYDSLKSTYTRRAIDAMRAEGSSSCPRCGPRREKDARFCSRCGYVLSRDHNRAAEER